MRNIVTAAAVAFLLGLSSPASAAEPTAKEPATETRWYGYQTLLSDAASVALLAGAAGSKSAGLVALGVGTYFVGGPLIHALNDRPQAVIPSALLRLGAPAVGGALGVGLGAATAGDSDYPETVMVFFGLVGVALGAGVAAIIDATKLAKETVPRPSSFTMGVAPTQGGLTIGAAGTF